MSVMIVLRVSQSILNCANRPPSPSVFLLIIPLSYSSTRCPDRRVFLARRFYRTGNLNAPWPSRHSFRVQWHYKVDTFCTLYQNQAPRTLRSACIMLKDAYPYTALRSSAAAADDYVRFFIQSIFLLYICICVYLWMNNKRMWDQRPVQVMRNDT